MQGLFTTLLVNPITNILVAIYVLLSHLYIPSALGFSIILLTILVRFILYPLTASQMKASRKMQQLSPHLSKLREKHKGDNTRLQQETMRLYREHGVNPAAGCLPVLIQLPIIWALYGVLREVVSLSSNQVVSKVNSIVYFPALKLHQPWDQHFFGFPLGQTPGHLMGTFGPLVLLIPVITGMLQFIQSKMMFPQQSPRSTTQKKEEDFATIFQTQTVYIFPFMIAFFSYSFPVGLSLYWNTYTIFGILQQYKIQGVGGIKNPFLKK